MTIPPRVRQAEKLELAEMRRGKSHAEAEQSEKRFLANRGRSGSLFPGFRNLKRGGKR